MNNREVMQQALSDICAARLCEINSMSSRGEMERLMDKAITALKAALAEPEQDAELAAALGWPGGISTPILDRHVLLDLVAKQRSAALAEFGADPQNVGQTQTESKQEPVAWINAARDVLTSHPESWGREDEDWQALYTHPAPQRQPLSLKEVEQLIYEHTKINPNVADDRELLGYIVNAVRAIERAHGIGGKE